MSLRSAAPVALHLPGFGPGHRVLPNPGSSSLDDGLRSGAEGLLVGSGREQAGASVTHYLSLRVPGKLGYAVF